MTLEEMREELYRRAGAYVAEARPGYAPDAMAGYARNGVDAMINARVTSGEDEAAALERALGQDIKKLITVVITE
jgi:hypothetical protein